MEINWTIVIVVALLVAVALIFALRYRGGGRARVTGPFGTSVEAEGKNLAPAKPGSATVEDAVAGGNVRARAAAGDATVRRAKAKRGDVEATSGGTDPNA